MKKIIYTLLIIAFSLNAYPQSTIKDFVTLVMDSDYVYPEVQFDSTRTNFTPAPEASGKEKQITKIGLYPHIPNSYEVDKGNDVGEIPYQSSLSPTGAMSINVPIEVYPDPRGFMPQVSLAYNSLGGNGPLGIGWGISGISIISRTNRTMYYDGKTEGINLYYSVGGPFLLDGQRLIKIGDVQGRKTYQTERGNIKVISYDDYESVQYFDVFYPDGSQAVYQQNNEVDYHISSMTDKSGNTISYTYESIGGNYRISKIRYGQQQQCSIEFSYISRTDIQTMFNGGKKSVIDYKLNTISVKFNNSIIKQYQLSYADVDNSSILKSIGCTSNDKVLNPLIFYHGDNNSSDTYKKEDTQLSKYYSDVLSIRTYKGKFDYGTDNDGIIMLPNKGQYVEYQRDWETGNHSENRIENQYTGNEEVVVATGLSGSLSGFNPTIYTGTGFVDIFCLDVDETAGEEIVKVNNYISGGSDKVDFHVYTSNLYNGIVEKYVRSFSFNTLLDHLGEKSITPKYYFTGDFNGDGKMEVIFVSTYNTMGKGVPSKCCILDLESNKILYEGNPFNYWVEFPRYGSTEISGDVAYANSDKLFAIDCDGDGKTELCLINNSEMKVYSFQANDWQLMANSSILNNTMFRDRNLLLGELNGDGKVDFLISPLKNSGVKEWKMLLSYGDNTFESREISLIEVDDSDYYLQDMNNDGISDLIESSYVSRGQYINTYFIQNLKLSSRRGISTNSGQAIIIPTNIQSRNYYSKLIAVNNDGIASRISYEKDCYRNRLLTGIINSYGVVTKIGYQQLNRGDLNLYVYGRGAQFPYQNYLGGLTVVDNIVTYHQNDRISDLNYLYRNGVIHKQGLGFRGFESIETWNSVIGERSTQTYDPFNFSVLKQYTSDKVKEDYTYDIRVETNKIAHINLVQKISTDRARSVSSSTSYAYNSLDCLINETINYGNGITTSSTNVYKNIDDERAYIVGLPETQSVTQTRDGHTSTQKVSLTYNSTYLPVTKKTYQGTRKVSEEQFSYDSSFNLITHKTKKYTSTNWLTDSYTYDSYGRVTQKTNPLGLYEDYAYDPLGNLYHMTNHKGLITGYVYDAWNRKTQTIYPDGTVQKFGYEWSTTVGLVMTSITASGKPTTKTFFDAFGREVRNAEIRFDGKYLYQDKAYDGKGRLQRASLPFKTAPSLWDNYTYDDFNRPLKVEYASGKTDTYSYSGLKETATINGLTSTKTYNALGEVVTISDAAGTIAYTYRPDGQPSSITAPGDVTTTFEYDAYGRQIKIIDPSAGTKSVDYDDAGNLRLEQDANGLIVTMKYDSFNRLIERSGGMPNEYEATYAYNTDGQLVSEICVNNQTGKDYSYDSYSRLSSIKEYSLDGKFLLKDYVYDPNGNIFQIKYSTQDGTIGTESYSYANGTKHMIHFGTEVWQLRQENESGQLINCTTGDLNRWYTYDTYGSPTGRRVNKLGDTDIQNLSYAFSAQTGNLEWRRDNKRNIQETFGYDHLNRLSTWGNQTLSYDIKGNITGNTAVGTFEYSRTKPYAIEIAEPANGISHDEQEVKYNVLMRPEWISEGDYSASFEYNGNGDRSRMRFYKNGSTQLKRYYIGNQYERDETATTTKERLYIAGDAYSAPAVLLKEGNGSWKTYYICRDNLGSITHVINESGNVVQELSYDPWGRLRNPSSHEVYMLGSEPELFLGRGFTGHEHLSVFGLINMNARLYDPALGRFLSPDPYVQMPYNSQNFNRYSYCLNNPLIYVDENGKYFGVDDLIAAGIGGFINLFSNLFQGNLSGHGLWKGIGRGFAAFGSGAVGGFGALYPQAGGWVWGGATVGATNSWLSGAKGWDIAIGAGVGVASSVVGGAVGQWGGQYIGGVIINGTQITSPVLQGAITGTIGGAAGGYAGGFTSGMIMTGGDWGEANSAGLKGAVFGAPIGGISGSVSAYRYAVRNDMNPWTGEVNMITAKDLGIEQSMDRISRGESHPHYNDGSEFRNGPHKFDGKIRLPEKPADYYHEYVVPTPGIKGAGTQRIVIGKGGEHYYTPDHYKTFIKFKY